MRRGDRVTDLTPAMRGEGRVHRLGNDGRVQVEWDQCWPRQPKRTWRGHDGVEVIPCSSVEL